MTALSVDTQNERLLDLARWALARLNRSADYVQVFAERTVEFRVECVDGEVLAACSEVHEGIGALVRHGATWRYRHAPFGDLGRFAEWLGAPATGWEPPFLPDPVSGAVFCPTRADDWLL